MEYDYILDKENKSTSILFFSNVDFSYHVGSKPYLQMQLIFMLIKETEMFLNLVTETAEQLI